MNCAGDSRAHLYFDSIIQAVSQSVGRGILWDMIPNIGTRTGNWLWLITDDITYKGVKARSLRMYFFLSFWKA